MLKIRSGFEREKILDKCRTKTSSRFDFYLPGYNLVIEYDGAQHFLPNHRFGKGLPLKEVKRRDARKNRLCKKLGIGILRIPYTEFSKIETILDDYFAALA